MSWFPHVRWLLIGDDGQHDPSIYAKAVDRRPDHVRAVAIRQLTGGQQVLAGNIPDGGATAADLEARPVPTVAGRDGDELTRQLATIPGVLAG